MYKLTEGQCLNNLSGFVCSESKAAQNYPCPYSDCKKCRFYIPITKEMTAQWETVGYIKMEVIK